MKLIAVFLDMLSKTHKGRRQFSRETINKEQISFSREQ